MISLAMNEKKEIIAKYQCPGCSCGHKPAECDAYELEEDGSMFRCKNHVCGTMLGLTQIVALGLPKYFNIVYHGLKPFEYADKKEPVPVLRIWENPPEYNELNVPVWAQDINGDLFVRCYMPRINFGIVDVIIGHKMEDVCPQAMNAGE